LQNARNFIFLEKKFINTPYGNSISAQIGTFQKFIYLFKLALNSFQKIIGNSGIQAYFLAKLKKIPVTEKSQFLKNIC